MLSRPTSQLRSGVLPVAFSLFIVLGLVVSGMIVSGCDGGGSEPTPPPSTPQGLTATATSSGIALSWNAGSASATGFNVYRVEGTDASTNGAPVNGSTPVAETAFEDTGVSEGVVYTYAVTAVNDRGESRASSGVTIRFFPDPPGRP